MAAGREPLTVVESAASWDAVKVHRTVLGTGLGTVPARGAGSAGAKESQWVPATALG